MEDQGITPSLPEELPPQHLPDAAAKPSEITQPETHKSLESKSVRFNLETFSHRIRMIISILLGLGAIVLVILLVVLFWHELTYKGYSLQEVYVPEAFEKNGYTGNVLAVKIEENLQRAKRLVARKGDPLHLGVKMEGIDVADYVVRDKGSELEVNMVGVGLPVRSFVNFVGSALGFTQSKRVTAYITTSGGKAIITMNIANQLSDGRVVNLDSLGMEASVHQLAQEACEYILKISNTEMLAQYLYESRQSSDKVVKTCEYAIAQNEDTTRNKYDYYYWAWALRRNNNYKEAAKKFRESISVDPGWVAPYLGLNAVLGEMGNYDEARIVIRNAVQLGSVKKFDKEKMAAIHFLFVETMVQYFLKNKKYDSAYFYARRSKRLNSKYKESRCEGYNNIAFTLSEGGRYDSALYYAQKAVEADSSQSNPYTTIAEIYGYQKNKEKFYFFVEKAFRKGLSSKDLSDSVAPYSYYRDETQFKALWKKYRK